MSSTPELTCQNFGLPQEFDNNGFILSVNSKPTLPTSLIKKRINNDVVSEMSAEEKAELIVNRCNYCVYKGCCEYGLTHHPQEICKTGITAYLKLEVKEDA